MPYSSMPAAHVQVAFHRRVPIGGRLYGGRHGQGLEKHCRSRADCALPPMSASTCTRRRIRIQMHMRPCAPDGRNTGGLCLCPRHTRILVRCAHRDGRWMCLLYPISGRVGTATASRAAELGQPDGRRGAWAVGSVAGTAAAHALWTAGQDGGTAQRKTALGQRGRRDAAGASSCFRFSVEGRPLCRP